MLVYKVLTLLHMTNNLYSNFKPVFSAIQEIVPCVVCRPCFLCRRHILREIEWFITCVGKGPEMCRKAQVELWSCCKILVSNCHKLNVYLVSNTIQILAKKCQKR